MRKAELNKPPLPEECGKEKVSEDLGVAMIDSYLNKLGSVASDEMKKSLSVTLTIHDLEEMLEAVYEKQYSDESKKTLQKLLTQIEDIAKLFIDNVISKEDNITLGTYVAGADTEPKTSQAYSGKRLQDSLKQAMPGKPTIEHVHALYVAGKEEEKA